MSSSIKYNEGTKNRVIRVANTRPNPSAIAIGARNADSPLVCIINDASPPNVVTVVSIALFEEAVVAK